MNTEQFEKPILKDKEGTKRINNQDNVVPNPGCVLTVTLVPKNRLSLESSRALAASSCLTK